MSCTFSILLTNNEAIRDITLSSSAGQTAPDLPSTGALQFLSVVETSQIPLYLATGSPYTVHTSSKDTESWFRNILLCTSTAQGSEWWESATVDSPLGILVAVPPCEDVAAKPGRPRVTEILFYASNATEQRVQDTPPTPPRSSPAPDKAGDDTGRSAPALKVHALALSSDLLWQAHGAVPTPPASPSAGHADEDGVFLRHPFLDDGSSVNQPPTRKRKSANDVFDEASERRTKARRKGGEGVAAAAAVKPETGVPMLQHHRRSNSNATQSTSFQTRPPSRSPSLAPSRPNTAVSRRSTLSRVHSVADASMATDADVEAKNKDQISRIVMAGMRLYGLSQSKRRKARGTSVPAAQAAEDDGEAESVDKKKDEEFKLIYHQVFKGTCFAFRSSLAGAQSAAFADAVRDVADRLLAIFCNDPFSQTGGNAFDCG